MEFHFLLAFITILLLVSLIVTLIKKCEKSNEYHERMLPPSPWKLPVIGHVHHLFGALPHHTLKRVSQKYGPIFHLQVGRISTVVISSREAPRELLKIQDPVCADRPESIAAKILTYNYSDIAFSPYNEYWRQMSKLMILQMLSAKNVRAFSSIRQDEASHLVRSIMNASGQPVNIKEHISRFTSMVTCRTAFGAEIKGRETMLDIVDRSLSLLSGFGLADLFPSLEIFCWSKYELLRVRRKLDAVLEDIVKEHRLKQRGEFGGEAIVDVLIRVQHSGELSVPITDDNIKAMIFDMFGAGSETTSSTVEWAMAELMRNPHVMEKAQEEIRSTLKGKDILEESDVQNLKYIQLIIKETPRMHPAAPLLVRACRHECVVGGYTIPPKTKVLFNSWAMARDPEYWDDPESFQPERFENSSVDFLGNNFEYIPFGAGKRMCPGMNFGIANVALPLAQLLYYFDWKMPNGMSSNDDMTESLGIAVARKNDLIIIPTIAISSPFEE